MTQASNLAQAINKLMQSKLDSSLRERYFIISQGREPSEISISNDTTGLESNRYIDIGPDDNIYIPSPFNNKESRVDTGFEGKISEAIDLGYVEGNFIFLEKGEPQEQI